MRAAVQSWAPRSATDFAAFVDDPATPLAGRLIALVDPLSRRHDWLLRTRHHGRRSGLADADYAAFMARHRRRAG